MTSLTPAELADSDRIGIIPRAVNQIFSELTKRVQSLGRKLAIDARNSYIEVYNEDLIDLLAGELGAGEKPQVTIREDKAGHIIWSGLRDLRVESAADVMR